MRSLNISERNGGIAKIIEKIDELYEHLEQLKVETISVLGKRRVLHIIDFHGNNWIDIARWIMTEYREEVKNSLLFFYYCIVSKEIYWMQLLFLLCNYSVIYRNLRYIWELIFQGYHVDSRCSGRILTGGSN